MSFPGGALFYRYFALQSRYQRLLGVILALFCVIFRNWVSATYDPVLPGQVGPCRCFSSCLHLRQQRVGQHHMTLGDIKWEMAGTSG